MKEWHALECNGCGVSTVFQALVELQWQAGGGMVTKPKGYACAQCGAVVDGAILIQRKQVALAKRDLAAQEAELDALTPPAAPKGKKAEVAG